MVPPSPRTEHAELPRRLLRVLRPVAPAALDRGQRRRSILQPTQQQLTHRLRQSDLEDVLGFGLHGGVVVKALHRIQVRIRYLAFNRHDADALASLLTDDTVFEDTSPAPDGQRIEGKTAVVAFKVEKELADLKGRGDSLKAQWQTEKEAVQSLRTSTFSRSSTKTTACGTPVLSEWTVAFSPATSSTSFRWSE